MTSLTYSLALLGWALDSFTRYVLSAPYVPRTVTGLGDGMKTMIQSLSLRITVHHRQAAQGIRSLGGSCEYWGRGKTKVTWRSGGAVDGSWWLYCFRIEWALQWVLQVREMDTGKAFLAQRATCPKEHLGNSESWRKTEGRVQGWGCGERRTQVSSGPGHEGSDILWSEIQI